jgi:hypothetical protein
MLVIVGRFCPPCKIRTNDSTNQPLLEHWSEHLLSSLHAEVIHSSIWLCSILVGGVVSEFIRRPKDKVKQFND